MFSIAGSTKSSQRSGLGAKRWPSMCLVLIVLVATIIQGQAVEINPVGASVCTFAPDKGCYEDGWPKCCSSQTDEEETCGNALKGDPLYECDRPPTEAPTLAPTTAAGPASNPVSASILVMMLLGVMAGI